jgi:hypothetical protein
MNGTSETVEPGEEHRINIKVKVKGSAYCPKTIVNKACVWAAELPDWICAEETTSIKCLPCIDECTYGEKMCSGTELLVCGNFDADACSEWGSKQECYFKEDGKTSYVCEWDSAIGYKGHQDRILQRQRYSGLLRLSHSQGESISGILRQD